MPTPPPKAPPPPPSVAGWIDGQGRPTTPGKPRQRSTYAGLIQAVREAWPGKLDHVDPSVLADVVLETYPHLRDQIDPLTKGSEGLVTRPQAPRAPDAIATVTPRKAEADWTDLGITTGLRVVPSIVGGALGGAAATTAAVATGGAAAPAVPWGVTAGAAAGGYLGEGLAEAYELGTGLGDDISQRNMAFQAMVNAVPFGRGFQAGARGVGALVAGRAPTLASAALKVGNASGAAARVGANVLEGAIGGVTGAAGDAAFLRGEVLDPATAGASALLGAGFGGVASGGLELHQRGKRVRAGKYVDKADQLRAMTLDAQHLPQEVRALAVRDVSTALQEAARLDPQAAAGGYQRLQAAMDGQHGQDLQIRATAFLETFADRAATLGPAGRLADAQEFLAGLREDRMSADAFDDVVRTMAGIDTMARETELAAGPKLLGAANPDDYLHPQSLGAGTIQPMAPAQYVGSGTPIPLRPSTIGHNEAVGVPGHQYAPERPPVLDELEIAKAVPPSVPYATGEAGAFHRRTSVPLPGTPTTTRIGGMRVPIDPPPAPPPEADWRNALSQEELAAERAAHKVEATRRLAAATPGALPLVPKSPWAPGPPAAALRPTEPRGVDTLGGVVKQHITRDDAAVLQWLRTDMEEVPFQQGGVTRTMLDEAEANFRGGDSDAARHGFTKGAARVAGTPTLDAIEAILGQSTDRTRLKDTITSLLEGRSKGGGVGKLAKAVKAYTRVLTAAYDPETRRLDWSRVPEKTWGPLGKHRTLIQRTAPRTPPDLAFNLDTEADDILAKYAPDLLRQKRGFEADALADPPMAEAIVPPDIRQFLGTHSDDAVQALHEDLLKLGAEPRAVEFRAWTSQVMEERGLSRPRQAPLLDSPADQHAVDVLPSEAVLALEEAASAQPRSTPVGAATGTEAPTYQALAAPLMPEDPDVLARRTTAPTMAEPPVPRETGPQGLGSLLGDETGAIGDVAQSRAARAARVAQFDQGTRAPRDLTVDADTFKQLRHAVEAAGESEAAGLILGTPDGRIQRVVVSRNVAQDPTAEFQISAQSLAATQQKARALGLEVLGSFHSQPTGSAAPSGRDLKGGVADLPMLILGTKGGTLRDVQVWQPKGKKVFEEGSLSVGGKAGEGTFPAERAPIRAAIERIPRFTGAVGDSAAVSSYLKSHAAELQTEPYFIKAQDALAAGNPKQAWLELQMAQVLYSKVTREAAGRLNTGTRSSAHESARLLQEVKALEARSIQDPAGQLWALYGGRTTWVEGVGRVVVTPQLPPRLQDVGVTAGAGGVLQAPDVTTSLPDATVRERITLDVVNDILADVKAKDILDDPTKISDTRLFRQVAEQMMLHPARFDAMTALGVTPEQAAAHFTDDVSQAARILASLAVWKRQHGLAIQHIEGIRGASGALEDVQIYGKGRRVGRLGDLTAKTTFDALVRPSTAWDRAILLNELSAGKIGTFDQFDRASTGFMLAQWATAMRNFNSATGRWGLEGATSVWHGLAWAASGDLTKAVNAWKRAGDLVTQAPVLRPGGWVMPWQARKLEWEQIFDFNSGLLQLAPADRRATLEALRSSPEHAGKFLGGMLFGEPAKSGVSGSKTLDWAASPQVQHTLQMFNRAQEFTVRSAIYHVELKNQLRQAGLDPERMLSLPPAQLKAMVGEEAWGKMLDKAVGYSLDFTFAGDTITRGFGRDPQGKISGSANGMLIGLINRLPVVRAGYKFPRFNLSAAPRYLWDHSGVGLVLDPLYSAIAKRGRYHLGKVANTFETTFIPEAQRKITDAKLEMTEALQGWQGIKQELAARRQAQARFDKMPQAQLALPDIQSKMQANQLRVAALSGVEAAQREKYFAADESVKSLLAQKRSLDATVQQAASANVPRTFQELFARNMTGAAILLPAAMALRADQRDKGTPWYRLNYGGVEIDTRPLAPFTQYLFVADVLQDFYYNTDWQAVATDMDDGLYTWDTIHKAFFEQGRYEGDHGLEDIILGVGAALLLPFEGAFKLPQSIYQVHEGKYTNQTIGKELTQAFLSISQAAGTTLALVEAGTDIGTQGFPSLPELGDLIMQSFGQMLGRYTIPARQFSAPVDALTGGDGHAAIVADKGNWAGALAAPVANLPFIGAKVVPPTYNQLSGQPLSSFMPGLRALTGITLRLHERVSGEVAEIGLAGSSTYLRTTGDDYLDEHLARQYAELVQETIPQVLDDPEYQQLDSPALRRDALAPVFSRLKKMAYGITAANLGLTDEQIKGEGSEAKRRRLRKERLELSMDEQHLRDTDSPTPESIFQGVEPPDSDEPEIGDALPPPG